MGVIDSLSAGYRLVSRRWWLILIPILLDLVLWMGPQISVAQPLQGLQGVLTPPAGLELSQEYQDMLRQTNEYLTQVARDSNLLTLLSIGIPGVPSLISGTSPQFDLLPVGRSTVQLDTLRQAILWGLGLLVAGALMAAVYVTWIGRSVFANSIFADGVHDDVRSVPLPVQALQTWLKLLLFVLVLLALVLIVSIPVLMLAGIMMLISQSLGVILVNLLMLLMLWLGIWVGVYLFFVVDAIVINRAGVFRSIWNSVNIVIRNFWPTVGLIVLTYVISAGMMLIWQQLGFAPWGTLLGIVANAFMGSGLVAASFIFYIERYVRWQKQQEALVKSMLGDEDPGGSREF